MSKIICDICGTRYPDSSEQCPICGYDGRGNNETEQETQVEEFEVPSRPVVKGGRFSKANVRKRLKNQAIYEEPEVRPVAAEEEEEEYESEEEYEEEDDKKGGKLLNVLLVIVIMALLAVSGYIFLNHFMPNFLGNKAEEATVPTEAIVEQTEAPTEAPTEEEVPTEAPTVPCQELVLDVTDITLREVGGMYLLNVQILPEDTTDSIMYISSNEDVATVNEEGRITAIGEGSVVITVLCGEQQLECNVVCDFSPEETEEPTEEPTEAGVTKTVTSNTLNIRSGAGTSNEKVGQYKKGDQIVIYEETTVGGQPWGRTDKGWVCMDYVK